MTEKQADSWPALAGHRPGITLAASLRATPESALEAGEAAIHCGQFASAE